MSFLWVVLAAVGGYFFGKNQATIKAVTDNRTKLQGAADIYAGIKEVLS